VKYLGGLKLDDPQKQILLDELMASTTDPVDDLAREVTKPVIPAADPLMRGNMANNSFNFTGPVTIHVYAPGGSGGPADMTIITPQPRAPEKVIRFDPDYAHREGYKPNFLGGGLVVPVPTVSTARDGELLKGANGKPRVLKYHHYELVMNEKRFMQMWSAVNVDYDPSLKATGDRKSFGSDKWIPDPRIPGEIQIQDAEFYKPAGNIDRGHIVRREDNAWGETDEEIEFANSDTFHWTNCTPQHEAFNQSTPGKNDPTYIGMKGLWGDFENHVQKNLGDGESQACILAGPVLSSRDPSKDFGFGKIKYPLRFWKVIAVAVTRNGHRELGVFGFLLSQRDVVKKFGIETFQPGKFKKYQVSLKKITELTGVVFDPVLHNADVMAGQPDKVPIVDGQESLTIRAKPQNGTPTSTSMSGKPSKPADGKPKD
jgi:endonuclease G